LYLPVLSPGRERRDERGERRETRGERGEERRGEEHIKMMAWGDEPERTTEEGFQTIVSRQKASVRWKELLSVFF
jgi:hypothetical protein